MELSGHTATKLMAEIILINNMSSITVM
jgi:hypothetical protein